MPKIDRSISAGSMPVRATSSPAAAPARSIESMSRKTVPALTNGVRQPSTIAIRPPGPFRFCLRVLWSAIESPVRTVSARVVISSGPRPGSPAAAAPAARRGRPPSIGPSTGASVAPCCSRSFVSSVDFAMVSLPRVVSIVPSNPYTTACRNAAPGHRRYHRNRHGSLLRQRAARRPPGEARLGPDRARGPGPGARAGAGTRAKRHLLPDPQPGVPALVLARGGRGGGLRPRAGVRVVGGEPVCPPERLASWSMPSRRTPSAAVGGRATSAPKSPWPRCSAPAGRATAWCSAPSPSGPRSRWSPPSPARRRSAPRSTAPATRGWPPATGRRSGRPATPASAAASRSG